LLELDQEKAMHPRSALRGFCTISFWADDVSAAAKWYAGLLGIEPYFARPEAGTPEYVEFRFGDYQHELGIIDKRYQPKAARPGPGGAVVYFHVDDLAGALERAKKLGAEEYEPLIEREAGFKTASVLDPFGNIVGLMYNPHYLEVRGSK
jgi:predicted enzyme related to lactoylglutathione lyase